MKLKVITLLAASLALVSCDKKNEGTISTDSTTMNQKEQVVALLKSIETGERIIVNITKAREYFEMEGKDDEEMIVARENVLKEKEEKIEFKEKELGSREASLKEIWLGRPSPHSHPRQRQLHGHSLP